MNEISSWVPQFFYDLIGRIAPGFILGLIVVFIIFEPADILAILSKKDLSVLLLTIVSIATSYVIGSLAGGLRSLFSKNFWKKLRTNSLIKDSEQNLVGDESILSFIYDSIKFYNSDAGTRLAKISAERHFAVVLMIGSGIILFVYFFTQLLFFDLEATKFIVIEIILFLIILSSWSYQKNVTIRSFELMKNNYKILINEGKIKPITNEAKNNDHSQAL